MAARLAIPALLAAVVMVCFWPALGAEFVNVDDPGMILRNPDYRGLGPSHLHWMFTTFLKGHYQPLAWVTLGLDYELWGMDPRGYHLTSVLFHAANTMLVYFLAESVFEVAGVASAGRRGAAALAAFLFGIHPLRVESVAWVTERRDVLSGFFLLLTLLAWFRLHTTRRKESRAWWYGAALVCYALSLLSKAWGITLPVVLLVLDAWPLGRFGRGGTRSAPVARLLLEKLPFAVLGLAAARIALAAVRSSGAAAGLTYTPLQRTMQAAYGLCFYVRKSLWPSDLAPAHLLDLDMSPAAPAYLLSALSVVAAGGLLLVLRRRWPSGLVAFLCYAIVVSPVLGFAQSGPQLVADRYSYLACIPLALLVAAGLGSLAPTSRSGRCAAATSLVIVAVLGVQTWKQARAWHDSLALWNHTLAADPENWWAYTLRGYHYQQTGHLEPAEADYDQAIRRNREYPLSFSNRGTVRAKRGDVVGALADWTRALELDPSLFDARLNRGSAHLAMGNPRAAAADFETVTRQQPGSYTAWYHLAQVQASLGDPSAAAESYRRALAAAPATWDLRARVEQTMAGLLPK